MKKTARIAPGKGGGGFLYQQKNKEYLMKTKNLSVLAAIALVFALVFTACDTGGGGGGGGGGKNGVARFNLTGAKAVLASGGQTSASGRAVARAVTENGLFKLLDNDSVVSVFSRNQDMAWITNMRGSPAETGRKDLYIQFGYSWTYKTDDGESVRIDSLIHVREDGTVVNVSDETRGNLTLTYSADFDRKGNLYFTMGDESTLRSTIYKYDPVTGKKELLSSDSFYYGKPFPSYDGSFLLVEGRNQSEVIIPCDNPGQAFDIFDITDKDFLSFAVSRTKREVYLSGNSNNGDRGLYKLSSVNGGISKDDWELTTLIEDFQEDVGGAVGQLYVAPDNSVWGHGWNGSANGFFRLIDRNEQSDNSFVSYGDNGTGLVKLSASHIYFLFLVPAGKWSIPRKILRLSYDFGNVEDLFDKIDFKGRNKNNIYVEEYSIAGGFLYFYGLEGVTLDHDGFLVGGDDFIAKINLTTFEYTEITWEEQACTAIVGW